MRLVRDYLEIGNVTTLDDLIERLIVARSSMPDSAQAEVRLRGDDHFGRHIAIAFKRPLTAEEAACERRYANGRSDDGMLSVAA